MQSSDVDQFRHCYMGTLRKLANRGKGELPNTSRLLRVVRKLEDIFSSRQLYVDIQYTLDERFRYPPKP